MQLQQCTHTQTSSSRARHNGFGVGFFSFSFNVYLFIFYSLLYTTVIIIIIVINVTEYYFILFVETSSKYRCRDAPSRLMVSLRFHSQCLLYCVRVFFFPLVRGRTHLFVICHVSVQTTAATTTTYIRRKRGCHPPPGD